MLFQVSAGGEAVTGHLNRMITDDGRRVFFTTVNALVPEDVNGKDDAYEYDVPTGTVSLISSGRSSADSYFMETNPSGDDAVFLTREQLVGWDTDTNYDLYDARVNGGLPEPVPSPPACSGQDCRPASVGAPEFTPGASLLVDGSGNIGERLRARGRRCRTGFVRRRVHGKVRCVRRVRHARRAGRRVRGARRSR